jgi:hypothetical protein
MGKEAMSRKKVVKRASTPKKSRSPVWHILHGPVVLGGKEYYRCILSDYPGTHNLALSALIF